MTLARLNSIVSRSFTISIALALIYLNAWTLAALIINAWAFIAIQIEIGVRERERKDKAAMLAGMDAAGVDRNNHTDLRI